MSHRRSLVRAPRRVRWGVLLLCTSALVSGCREEGRVGSRVASPSGAAGAAVAVPTRSSTAVAATAPSAVHSASVPTSVHPASLEALLRGADPRLDGWLDHARELRLQLLVTEVLPQADAAVRLEERGFRVDAEYVYPASAIKTFLAVAALRTLRRLGEQHHCTVDGATRLLRCREDRAGCKPPPADEKPAADGGEPEHEKLWVGQEIRKLLSYSDNDSYDRLYDIVGHRELNEQMAALGFSSVRFHHRMGAPAARSKRTCRVTLLPRGGPALSVPQRTSDLELAPTPATDLLIGTAHNSERGRVDEPMSFADKNYASLRDMQRLNLSLLFPESANAVDLGLVADDRALIIEAMTGKLEPLRHAERHKPLLPGVLEVIPAEHLRYVGKSGRAYGFHLENAYLEDTRTKRGLLVTVSVYSNPNGVLNDDDYGYDETTIPLLRTLGKVLAEKLLALPHAAGGG